MYGNCPGFYSIHSEAESVHPWLDLYNELISYLNQIYLFPMFIQEWITLSRYTINALWRLLLTPGSSQVYWISHPAYLPLKSRVTKQHKKIFATPKQCGVITNQRICNAEVCSYNGFKDLQYQCEVNSDRTAVHIQ